MDLIINREDAPLMSLHTNVQSLATLQALAGFIVCKLSATDEESESNWTQLKDQIAVLEKGIYDKIYEQIGVVDFSSIVNEKKD